MPTTSTCIPPTFVVVAAVLVGCDPIVETTDPWASSGAMARAAGVPVVPVDVGEAGAGSVAGKVADCVVEGFQKLHRQRTEILG
jgi:hypothetical protein